MRHQPVQQRQTHVFQGLSIALGAGVSRDNAVKRLVLAPKPGKAQLRDHRALNGIALRNWLGQYLRNTHKRDAVSKQSLDGASNCTQITVCMRVFLFGCRDELLHGRLGVEIPSYCTGALVGLVYDSRDKIVQLHVHVRCLDVPGGHSCRLCVHPPRYAHAANTMPTKRRLSAELKAAGMQASLRGPAAPGGMKSKRAKSKEGIPPVLAPAVTGAGARATEVSHGTAVALTPSHAGSGNQTFRRRVDLRPLKRRPKEKSHAAHGKPLQPRALAQQAAGSSSTKPTPPHSQQLKEAMQRVGVSHPEELLHGAIPDLVKEFIPGKRSRSRVRSRRSMPGKDSSKLQQITSAYRPRQRRNPERPRRRDSQPQLMDEEASVHCLQELVECLAQRQMQQAQLARIMLGRARFFRDPSRVQGLVQDIGTMEAELQEAEGELLSQLERSVLFAGGPAAVQALTQALVSITQALTAELTDEVTAAVSADASEALKDDWRLRIGVLLHAVPAIGQGSFKQLVSQVEAARSKFTSELERFAEVGSFDDTGRREAEQWLAGMHSQAQLAMEMVWRVRESKRKARAVARAAAHSSNAARQDEAEAPGPPVGSSTAPSAGLLQALEAHKASMKGGVQSTTPPGQPARPSKTHRQAAVIQAEAAVVAGIEDVRSGLRDMLAKARTRRQPSQGSTPAAQVSFSVPPSPAKLAVPEWDTQPIQRPLSVAAAPASPAAQPDLVGIPAWSSEVATSTPPRAARAALPSPSVSFQVSPISPAGSRSATQSVRSAKNTAAVSPSTDRFEDSVRLELSQSTTPSPIKQAPFSSGLWNASLLQRTSPVQPSQSPQARSTAVDWAATAEALQEVTGEALDESKPAPSTARPGLLRAIKRRHAAVRRSIDTALSTVQQHNQHPQSPAKAQASATVHVPDVPTTFLHSLVAQHLSLWALRVLNRRRTAHAWHRNKSQSRWFQLVNLRAAAAPRRRRDRIDSAVLTLQRFARRVPALAAFQQRVRAKAARQRRRRRQAFLDAAQLYDESKPVMEAACSTLSRASVLSSACEDLHTHMQARLQEQFQAWRARLLSELLRERLPSNWEVVHAGSHDTRPPPHRDLVAGEGLVSGVSYVNTKTGARCTSHPNMRRVKHIAKQQRAEAETCMQAAHETIRRFQEATRAAAEMSASTALASLSAAWALLQGNLSRRRQTRKSTEACPPSGKRFSPRHEHASAPDFSPLVSPTKQEPSQPVQALELDEVALYERSQLAPGLAQQPTKKRPARDTRPSALTSMLETTKGRLTALLAKAMQ